MKRLVVLWHTVHQLSAWRSWCNKEAIIDGIHIHRFATIHSIYFVARIRWLDHRKNIAPDIIIDEAWGIPLLSPLFAWNTPKVFFLHHIGDKDRQYSLPFPLDRIFKICFFVLLRLYKHLPTLTISNSSKEELQALQFKNVSVIEDTTELNPIDEIDFRNKKKQYCILGRITPPKQIEDAIKAFHIVHTNHPDTHLYIMWHGQHKKYLEYLHTLVNKLHISDHVHFTWRVSWEERNTLLEESLFCISTSCKEGYGLTMLEANAYGTPAIWYDVPGLRDSIKHTISGIHIPDKNIQQLATTLQYYLAHEDTYQELARSALRYIKSHPTWNDQVKVFETYCEHIVTWNTKKKET